LLGSTAWAEGRAWSLAATAVAYLNVDVGVSGHDLSVHASSLLAPLVRSAVTALTDPKTGNPLSQVWNGEIGDLGSGSDYTVFLDRLGIPSLDLSFRPNQAPTLYGTYHSTYDSFSYMEQQVDPDFKYHQLQSQLWGLIALRMSSQRVVPLAPSALAADLYRYITYVKNLIEGKGCSGQCSRIRRGVAHRKRSGISAYDVLDLTPLQQAATSFAAAATDPQLEFELALCALERAPPRARHGPVERCGPKRLARLNEALRLVERGEATLVVHT
jgi:N-acetylated-alpha-linked acidic dipeptidase